jgi:signal transduction histidine kinase
MIAREAVTNALKHARARRIHLAVDMEGRRLRMAIADDGCGFDPAAPRGSQAGHFGCIGIEERCEKLGATVRWHSTPGQGTTVEVELPLESSPASLTA